MIDNTVCPVGVLTHFKSALAFSIMDGNLLLQNGAAYDPKGTLLKLENGPYTVLTNIDLVFFENHKKYRFYIVSEEIYNEINSKDMLTSSKVEEDVYFLLTTLHIEISVLLGEIEIDYDLGNTQGKRSICVPKNAFFVGKNEIDLKNVPKISIFSSPISESEQEKMSQILFSLAEVLHHKMIEDDHVELSTLSSTFFECSNRVKERGYTPYELYQRIENHIKLFTWIDQFDINEEVLEYLQRLKALFSTDASMYHTSFYYFDMEDRESLFYQVFHIFEEMTGLLQKKRFFSEGKERMSEETGSPYISEEFSVETFVPENITVVEEPVEEGHATVLLGGDRASFVQIGRGSQSGNDIVIGRDDKTVSRIHLKITAHKQGFFLEDLSSMGTYVNGERIEKNVKKFVTVKHTVVLGKKNCILDLTDIKIQALLNK